MFSGQVTAVADTTATVQVSTDVESGTAYAYLSASSTPPYWRTIKNSPTDTETITGPTISFAMTGLPSSSTRYLHVLARKTTGTISRIATVTITTQAGSGPGASGEDYSIDGPASASSTKYFIDSVSGNNANTGLSHAQAWASLAPFFALNQNTLPVGTDLWIKAGSSLSALSYQSTFSVNGSFANRARVACYYVDTGDGNALKDCRTGTLGGELDLDTGLMGTLEPWEIYGSLTKTALLTLVQDWYYPRADCHRGWSWGMSFTKSHSSVEGGRVRDIACGGIVVAPDAAPHAVAEGVLVYPVVRDMQVERVVGSPLLIAFGVKYGLAQRVRYNRGGVCRAVYWAGGSAPGTHSLTFNSGGTNTPIPGQTMVSPSGGTARISGVNVTSGSWGAGTAAGTIQLNDVTGSFATTSPLNITVNGIADQFTTTQVKQNFDSATGCGGPNSGWPGGTTVAFSKNAFTVLDQIKGDRTFTEASNILTSSKVVIRRSRFANSLSGGSYLDAGSYSIIERNLYTSTKRHVGYPGQGIDNFGGGPTQSFEDIQLSANLTAFGLDKSVENIYRANIAVSVGFTNGHETNAIAAGKHDSFWVLGNTIIDPRVYAIDMNTVGVFDFGYFQNNLISGKAGTGYAYTYPSWYTAADNTYAAGDCVNTLAANYNAWESVGSGTAFTNCTGANDVGRSGGVTQSTALKIVRGITSTNNSDFAKALDAHNPMRAEDFALLDGSPARSAGTGVWKTTKLISDGDAAEFYKVLEPYTEIDTAQELLNWQMGDYYDFNGAERTTDIGALNYTATIPPLVVTADGRGFTRGGKPFVYTGDTAWAAQDLTQTQIRQYLDDRAAKGFNVIHGPILLRCTVSFELCNSTTELTDDPDGDLPLTSLSPVTLNNAYWTHIDYWVAEAAKRKLYVAMPLLWGPTADTLFTTNTQAYDLGKLIAQRYASSPNVIYMVMGEYHKIAWQTAVNDDTSISASEYALIDNYAQGVEDYKHADQLITIHANAGYDSSVLIPETWLDYSQMQSYTYQQNTVDIIATHIATSPRKPTMDSEGAYEGGDAATYGRTVTAWITRTFLYLSAFSGGAGGVYGAWDIWRFATGWETAMALPGATTAVRFGDIMRRIGLEDMEPAQSLVISGAGSYTYGTDTANRLIKNSDSSRVAVYSEKGNSFTLNLPTKRYEMRWINPRNGDETLGAVFTGTSSTAFDPPNSPAEDNDWVLFLVEL